MDRLTHPRVNGIKSGYWSPNKKDELIERLAAYENTGLSPSDVEQLLDQSLKLMEQSMGLLEDRST